MKTRNIIKGSWLTALILILGSNVSAFSANEDEYADTLNFNSYSGKIVNEENGKALPFATIEAVGSNIATVSNLDGDFSIKIAKDCRSDPA